MQIVHGDMGELMYKVAGFDSQAGPGDDHGAQVGAGAEFFPGGAPPTRISYSAGWGISGPMVSSMVGSSCACSTSRASGV